MGKLFFFGYFILVPVPYLPFISPFIRKGLFDDEYRGYQTKCPHNRGEPEGNMDSFFVRAPYNSLSRWVELSNISQGLSNLSDNLNKSYDNYLDIILILENVRTSSISAPESLL